MSVADDAAGALGPETAEFGSEIDPADLVRSMVSAFTRPPLRPARAANALAHFGGVLTKLGPVTLARALGGKPAPPIEVDPGDRRFAEGAWEENPAFFALRQAYLALGRLGDELLTAGSRGSISDAKARLAWEFLVAASSPTNFLLTNPAALRRAAETRGRSVAAGMSNFVDDLIHNGGRPRQVDISSFELGRNLAATPGKVVYRNDLMELIQYAPQTEQVYTVPLLASPPWINKYYVMDLAPGRSFIEYAVQQGHTVFAISYRNPDNSMRDVTMDDYLIDGPHTAIDVITEITGSAKVNAVGLCLGGALTAMTAAYLAQSEPERIGSITLLNTLLDYSEPGALGVFTDEAAVARLERQMSRTGYLAERSMASTFDVLRPNDLIFNYVVSNWLLGEPPPAFDILAWNADSTRMPATMHAFYLRSLYVRNLLSRGELELAGRRLDLGDVTSDAYVVGAINDHIVPWTASYRATQLLGGKVRYALSSGGHIAGIVNPPNPKAWYQVATSYPGSGAEWRAASRRRKGSWWLDWARWAGAKQRAGTLREPPPTGDGAYPPLLDAPGEYVRG